MSVLRLAMAHRSAAWAARCPTLWLRPGCWYAR